MKNYRKIYSEHYGIVIEKGYVIHHMDGNRENNKVSNLLLLPSKLHSKYHFYKNIIESWDKNTNLECLFPNVYMMNALEEFCETCQDCFWYLRMKYSLDSGVDPEYFGLQRRIDCGNTKKSAKR